jgi:hypothetical protein
MEKRQIRLRTDQLIRERDRVATGLIVAPNPQHHFFEHRRSVLTGRMICRHPLCVISPGA